MMQCWFCLTSAKICRGKKGTQKDPKNVQPTTFRAWGRHQSARDDESHISRAGGQVETSVALRQLQRLDLFGGGGLKVGQSGKKGT